MATKVTEATKLAIAKDAFFNKLSTKQLAEKYQVSESTVKRAKVSHLEQARKMTVSPVKKKAKATKPARGFKGRNGRVSLMNEVFAEHSPHGKSSELLDIFNKASVKAGMKEVKKASFYAMLSVYRRMHPEAA